jgi:hypothetical protein
VNLSIDDAHFRAPPGLHAGSLWPKAGIWRDIMPQPFKPQTSKSTPRPRWLPNTANSPVQARENDASLPTADQSANAVADAKPDPASSRMADIREMLIHAAMTILERSERIGERLSAVDFRVHMFVPMWRV